MTISLNGQHLNRMSGLSDLCRHALRFIQFGEEWVHTALVDQQVYAFAGESEMLAEIQTGLHPTPYALLTRSKAYVAPAKFMTMSAGELSTLYKAETAKPDSKSQHHAAGILQAHSILTQDDFRKDTTYLEELGIADAPIFQFLGLPELRAIFDLFNDFPRRDEEDLSLEKEAAVFAINHAQGPVDFTDYFRIYMGLALASGPAKHTDRVKKAERAVATVTPHLLDHLKCPAVDGLVSPADVQSAIRTWLGHGEMLGFPCLSVGVREIVLHANYAETDDRILSKRIRAYLIRARDCLAEAKVRNPRMAQDGATCTYTFDRKGDASLVTLNPGGVISLTAFRPHAEPVPHPAPPAKRRQVTSQENES